MYCMMKTIFDEISDAYPALTNTQIYEIHWLLFQFTGDEVFTSLEIYPEAKKAVFHWQNLCCQKQIS